MAKNLLIVESPTKERTIGKMLGKDFVIRSSYGHVRDLPTRELGVDVDKGFEPDYVTLPKAKKILPELQKLAEKAESVFIATDYDREGEAIAWHLAKVLKLDQKKARRITFHEITKDAIRHAMKEPRNIDQSLVNAQVARRVLDRLVGYRLSPLLWRKIRRGLSAGRVQSAAVRLICERDEEIAKFVPEEYWTVAVELDKQGQVFSAALYGEGDKKFDKFAFREKAAVDQVLQNLEGASYAVKSVEPKEKRRSPPAPFTTASLQQDAAHRLHFSASRTMLVAQQLYEGVELGAGEDGVGLITYMRTDSVQVAKEAREEAVEWIEKTYGKEHLPLKPRTYKSKNKRAQEAHEAIRPTKPSRTPESVKNALTPEQYKLYELIWQRFMASQMADALYDTLTVDIAAVATNTSYIFRATGRALRFAGFLAVYGEAPEEKDKPAPDTEDSVASVSLPLLAAGDALLLKSLKPEQHFTEPPPRFNEASLVKTLEEHGIGRPSTYAPIIQTIQERGYVRLEDRRFFTTDLGRTVDQQLREHFPEIVDVRFTAQVEDMLDQIASSEADWQKVVGSFYEPFMKDIEKAETGMAKVEMKPVETDEKCPRCGSPMVLRENRYGRYLACTSYPTCKSTIPVDREGKKIVPQETTEVCPNCGKPMLLKIRGRIRFIACSGYPDCRTTFSVDRDGNKIVRPKPEMTDQKCQKCSRPMLKRFGKRGPFLACSGFPKCRNIKPVPDDETSTSDTPKTEEGQPNAGAVQSAPAVGKQATKSKPAKSRRREKSNQEVISGPETPKSEPNPEPTGSISHPKDS